MPKVTIQFNLPEEREEYETAMKAEKYRRVLWEYDQYLRGVQKYGDDGGAEGFTLDKAREKFWEKMREEGCDLDD